MKAFNFSAADYSEAYQRDGYIHVKGGANPDFVKFAKDQWLRLASEKKAMGEWHFKNKKKQYLFDFPDEECLPALKQALSTIAGMPLEDWTLCERHIKAYEDIAEDRVPAHKDRLQAELTLGFALEVPENSHVVAWPNDHLVINPFSSTKAWRDSLDEEDLPENVLADIEPARLYVMPGDVHMFRGNSIYHERENPANTTILYLKFNAMRLDCIAEDPSTPLQRQRSIELIQNISDDDLINSRIEISPRIDKISRHYTRLYWKEVLQVYIWNEKEFTISEEELSLFKAIQKGFTINDTMHHLGVPHLERPAHLAKFKRLIKNGGIDLLG